MTGLAKINDICAINPSKKEGYNMHSSQLVSFVDMASVSENGEIIKEQTKKLQDVIKGYTYFAKGDIILAKITPCFENGKRAYANNLKNQVGFGSTEFIVLRPNEDIIPKYLFYLISRKKFREELTPLLVGTAGQKRLHKDVLGNYLIPVPSKMEQYKIIEKLDKIVKIKNLRKKQDDCFDELIKSKFLSLFSHPTNNIFPSVNLGSVAKLSMGGTPSTKKPEYYTDGTINWMRSGDITSDYIEKVPTKITQVGLDNSNTKLYSIGDVVIALNGQGKTRATTGILNVETSSNQSVASISPKLDILLSEYLHFDLKFRYQELRNITGDKQRSGLNLTLLRKLDIPLPPIELQKEFSVFVRRVEVMKNKQKASQHEIEQLFESVLDNLYS